jgi:phosphoserine phosphatase RsbU/P
VIGEAQLAPIFRGEIASILASAFFLFICLIALSIAAIRPTKSARLLLWLGVWSGLYGAQEVLLSDPVVQNLPVLLQAHRGFFLLSFNYLIIVAATLAFLELTLGILHRLLQFALIADVAAAITAIMLFVVSRTQNALLRYNELLVSILLVALLLTLLIPTLSRRFLVLARHRVLTAGTLIFAAQALWVNFARPLHIRVPDSYNTLGFAIFLLSMAYTGVETVVNDARRLQLLDDELAIARKLQLSILPERTPQIAGLDIAAVYKPMSAVAGDFYEFLCPDSKPCGFLIADVSGHGVPAALIASMIKVAAQMMNGCASDPAEFLAGVGRILHKNLQGQLVSAAYLCIDMAAHTARYSAAGHPPLVRWRKTDGSFTRLESNGLPFGVKAVSEYPVCNFPVFPGDRFLLYTDGVTEPENEARQQFGENRLEQIMRDNESRSVSDLSQLLPDEIRVWQPSNTAQQDDMTLILIDVLEGPPACNHV